MSKALELVATLAAEGTLESRGQFTLDKAKAREKLQKFQLAEPERYVVLLAEAALMGGATFLEVDIDGDDVRMRFDGYLLEREALEEIWDAVLSGGGGQRGMRQLALGLNAAMGLRPKYVRVDSGPPDARYRLELRPDKEMQIADLPVDDSCNLVHVRERLHFGTFAEALDARRGERLEQILLRDHCRFVDQRVTLDGKKISMGFPTQFGAHSVHFEGDGFEGRVGLRVDGSPTTRITFCAHGLKITSLRAENFPPGLVCLVNSTKLQRDVSQADVRRDDHFQLLMAQIHRAAWTCIASAAPAILNAEPDPDPGLSPAYLENILFVALESCGPDALTDGHPIAPLLDQALWKTVSGEPRTTRELLSTMAICKQIEIIWNKFEDFIPAGEEEVLATYDESHRNALRVLFPDAVKCRHSTFARGLKAHKNEMRWRARRLKPSLPQEQWSRRLAFCEGRVRGELGLRHRPGRIDILVEGGHLCSFEPDTGLKGLHVVVEGPFTPRKNFDGVHRNEHLVRALMLISRAIADLLALEFAGDQPSESAVTYRSAIPFLVEEPFGLALLVSAGFKRDRAMRVLKKLDLESTRPQLHPSREDPHPLTQIPVFAVVQHSRRISLAEVAGLFATGAPIPYFDSSGRGVAFHPDAPPALILDAETMELVEHVFGAGRLVDGAPNHERWRARQAHLSKKVLFGLDQVLRHQPLLVGIRTLEEQGVVAVFAMIPALLHMYWGSTSNRAPLQARHAGRFVADLSLRASIPGLTVFAEVPENFCSSDYSGVSEAGFRVLHTLLHTYESEIDYEAASGWGLSQDELSGLCRAMVWRSRHFKHHAKYLKDQLRPYTQQICLFTLQGQVVSLEELEARAATQGALEWADRKDLAPFADGPLIGGDETQREFVEAVLPFPSRDIGEELHSRKRSQELLAMPAVKDLSLTRATLVELEIDQEVKGGRLRGKLALPRIDPFTETGRLACYHKMRHIVSMESQVDLPVDAVLDGPWTLGDHNSVRRDQSYGAIIKAVEDNYLQLLAKLLESEMSQGGGPQALRTRWTVALAGAIGSDTMPAEDWANILRLPFLSRFETDPTTVLALQVLVEGDKPLSWVEVDRVRALQPPKGILTLDAVMAEELTRTFGLPLHDGTDSLYQRQLAKHARPELETLVPRPWPPHTAFHSLSVEGQLEEGGPGWTASLWLDPFERPVQVCCEGRFIMEADLWSGFSVSGVLDLPPQAIADSWTSADLTFVHAKLRRAGCDLVSELIGLVRANEVVPLARHRLGAMIGTLSAVGDEEDCENKSLHKKLRSARLFRDHSPNGDAWVSVVEIERREQLAQDLKVKEERARKNARRDARKMARVLSFDNDDLEEVLAATPTHKAKEPKVDHELNFTLMLHAQLDKAATAARWSLAEANIDQVALSNSLSSGTYEYEDGPRLNASHPLFRHAIEKQDQDPAALILCASVAAGAINLWLEEITDQDELKITLQLMRQLASAK